MNQTKRCLTCGRTLPRADFYLSSKSSDGLASECKICSKERNYRRYRRSDHSAVNEKLCKGCSHNKTRSEFPASPASPDGLATLCHACSTGKRRRTLYGLNAFDIGVLLEISCGVCEICGRPHGDRTCIDHDHTTGLLRGVLCSPCNMGLGLVHDNILVLISAAEYLWLAPMTAEPFSKRPVAPQSRTMQFDYRCRACKRIKSHDEFVASKRSHRGIKTICKACNTLAEKLRRTGMSHENLCALFDSSCGLCAVCHQPYGDQSKIDKDASTGVVRGVLCVRCNSMLAMFDYRSEVLMSAAEYLSING